MKLALVLGKAQGNSIKQRLQGIKDNLDIDCFENVADFINVAIMRNSLYDRILVLSTLINQETATDLYQYWNTRSRDTNIVMLCKKDKDEQLARNFMGVFKTPLVTSMLVGNTTVAIIAEAVLNPVQDINAKYGIKDFLKVEVETNTYEQPKPVEPEQPKQPQVQQDKKEKRSLLGALFGGKKNKGTEQPDQQGQQGVQNLQQEQQGVQQVQQNSQITQNPQQGQLNSQMVQNPQQGQPNHQIMQNPQLQTNSQMMQGQQIQQNINVGQPSIGSQMTGQSTRGSQMTDRSSMDSQMTGQSSKKEVGSKGGLFNLKGKSGVDSKKKNRYQMAQDTVNNSQKISLAKPENSSFSDDLLSSNSNIQMSDATVQVVDDISEVSFLEGSEQNSGNNQDNYNSSQYQYQQTYDNTQVNNQSLQRNFNVDLSKPVLPVVNDDDFGYMPNDIQVNDFAPDPKIVDEDFGSIPESYSTQIPDQAGVVSVDDDFSNEDIASMEAKYREATNQPKVVTKVVEKEVIRNIGGGKTALAGIYNGKLKKVLIVTGDRATGITSTAMTVAKIMSKKVPVLYFDCDSDNHGLLSYIDYANFKNYENTHMQGIKLCHSGNIFDKCVVRYDDNLDILSSDYDCVCSDKELQETQEVVAEKAENYGVVIVDCPIDKLSLIPDLLLVGQTVICVEGSKRGFMNMLCRLEACSITDRLKRTIVSRGTMFVTKCAKDLNLKQLLGYVKSIYEPDVVNWMSMTTVPFNGKLDDKLLNDIFEG